MPSQNTGVLVLIGTYNRDRKTVICPFTNAETSYCESGCVNHKFCPAHWSHFEDKGAKVKA